MDPVRRLRGNRHSRSSTRAAAPQAPTTTNRNRKKFRGFTEPQRAWRRAPTRPRPIVSEVPTAAMADRNRGSTCYRLCLWRWRFRSLRCLCFRIFLRRFLTTLPTYFPHLQTSAICRDLPIFRRSRRSCAPNSQARTGARMDSAREPQVKLRGRLGDPTQERMEEWENPQARDERRQASAASRSLRIAAASADPRLGAARR